MFSFLWMCIYTLCVVVWTKRSLAFSLSLLQTIFSHTKGGFVFVLPETIESWLCLKGGALHARNTSAHTLTHIRLPRASPRQQTKNTHGNAKPAKSRIGWFDVCWFASRTRRGVWHSYTHTPKRSFLHAHQHQRENGVAATQIFLYMSTTSASTHTHTHIPIKTNNATSVVPSI